MAVMACVFLPSVWAQDRKGDDASTTGPQSPAITGKANVVKYAAPDASKVKPTDKKKDAPIAEKKTEAAPPAAETPKSVEVNDAAFLETLDDYQLIQREIGRLEGVSGMQNIPVSIAQLRQRGDAKMAKLKEWMKEHKVGDDWTYNGATRTFTAPEPKKAEAAKPPEGEAEVNKAPAVSQGPGSVSQIGGSGNSAVVNGGQGRVVQKGGKGNTAVIKPGPASEGEAKKP
jgi:hypothetical protein